MCGCPSGETNCSGTCTNTQASDAANCGTCGHGCLGGTCSGGVCQRWTVANASFTATPVNLAVDATNLYWTDDGLNGVMQVSASQAGATPINLTTLGTTVSFLGIAVTGSTLVFTTIDENVIVTSQLWKASVGVQNQSLTALDTFSRVGPLRGGVAVNSTGATAYIMVNTQDSLGNYTQSTTLYACPIGTANACTSLTTAATSITDGPVISGGFLFFDDYNNNEIERYTLPSGPLNGSFVSPLPLSPGIMAADSTRAYFAYNGDGTEQTVTTEGIVNNSTNGGAVPQGFANTTGGAGGLASDGKFLYFDWINYNTNPSTGDIQYASVSGGPVTTLYTGVAPTGVVVGPNGGIYWIDGTTIYGQRFP